VLSAAAGADERVSAAHRAKLAYVYVRQSSVNQVRQHQESTELQYRLVDRAVGLGWPRERVLVIDEDLGKSGAASAGRHGFQRLIAEIGLGNAGLVLSLDASRLARNNRDWHQLLELCSLFGVILADGERLYDPGAYHDRLLLGLSGIMSEAELHQIRLRLHQGVASCGSPCRPGSPTTARGRLSATPMRRCRPACSWCSLNSPSCRARAG
jgi:DNA invertase Pin-like site-specific DNA recombinase